MTTDAKMVMEPERCIEDSKNWADYTPEASVAD